MPFGLSGTAHWKTAPAARFDHLYQYPHHAPQSVRFLFDAPAISTPLKTFSAYQEQTPSNPLKFFSAYQEQSASIPQTSFTDYREPHRPIRNGPSDDPERIIGLSGTLLRPIGNSLIPESKSERGTWALDRGSNFFNPLNLFNYPCMIIIPLTLKSAF